MKRYVCVACGSDEVSNVEDTVHGLEGTCLTTGYTNVRVVEVLVPRRRDPRTGRFIDEERYWALVKRNLTAWEDFADENPISDDLLPTCQICARVGADHSRTLRIFEAGYTGSVW